MAYTLETDRGPFQRLLSLSEAAEIWDIDDSTIRRAIMDGRLVLDRDCHKYGKQWVVTVDAMRQNFERYGGAPWAEYMTTLRKAANEKS